MTLRALCADPADLLDEPIVQELGAGVVVRSVLELDALGGWIFITISDHPMSTAHLIRWIRLQRPRLLPQAIEHAIRALANGGLIEIDGDRWRPKQFAAIGMQLRSSNE